MAQLATLLMLYMVLQPVPYEFLPLFDFKRSWIPVPQNIPTHNLGVDPNDIVNKLEKDDAFSLVADVTLSPSLESTDMVTPHPVQVVWSNRGMVYYGRCILASLTNMGLVTFHILSNKQWIIIYNLSDALVKHLQNDWNDNPSKLALLKPIDQLCHLKKRVYQVKTTTIGWSPIFDNTNSCYSYFFTGQTNGDIVMWRISSVVNESFKSEPKFLLILNSNLKRMTCINWFSMTLSKGIIVVGDHCGIIKLFEITLDKTNPDKVDLKYLVDIWPECDNISVKKVECLGEGPNLSDRCLIAIKGNFLITISIGDDGTLLDRRSLHMGCFNIVGCVSVENFSIILITQRGNMTKLDISKANNGKINVCIKEMISGMEMSEKLCFGIVASSNKMIWMMANSVYKPYDHLVLREPTTAVVFTFNFLPNPLNILKNNPSQRLTLYWDCLEMFRVLLARGRHFKVEVDLENLYSRNIYDLRCNLWMVTIHSKFLSQGNEYSVEMKNLLKKLEDAIFLQHSCTVLQKLLSSELSSLTDVQIQSFSLFYKWLKKFVEESDGENEKQFQSLLDLVAKKDGFLSMITQETCGLCKENVKMNYWKNAECDAVLPNKEEDSKNFGHCVARCSLSLIQCLKLPYRICYICCALATEQLVHEDEPICIFCNGRLNLDDRLIS